MHDAASTHRAGSRGPKILALVSVVPISSVPNAREAELLAPQAIGVFPGMGEFLLD